MSSQPVIPQAQVRPFSAAHDVTAASRDFQYTLRSPKKGSNTGSSHVRWLGGFQCVQDIFSLSSSEKLT